MLSAIEENTGLSAWLEGELFVLLASDVIGCDSLDTGELILNVLRHTRITRKTEMAFRKVKETEQIPDFG